jgi:hypothetical protein
MPIDFADVDFQVRVPDIPTSAPAAVLSAPCLRDHARAVDGLAKALGFDVRATVDVPHGFAAGSPAGQVEVFAASGALRARNTDRLAKFEDERREWADVVKDDSDPTIGIVYRLGDATSKRLTATSRRLLKSLELDTDGASTAVRLGQWARLDEDGRELESGPGRATVQLTYSVDGVRLIGPGAKTNIHFDPDEAGEGGVIARFFHVHRGAEGANDVRLVGIEEAFQPLLTQTWSGITPDAQRARLSITSIQYGLLALPADVPQRHAAPALVVEGSLAGVVAGDGSEVTLRFGQYLPLTSAASLAEAGLGSTGPVIAGTVVTRRPRPD